MPNIFKVILGQEINYFKNRGFFLFSRKKEFIILRLYIGLNLYIYDIFR